MAASSATAGGAACDWLARLFDGDRAELADAIERHAREANPGGARADPRRRVRRLIASLAAERVRVNLGALDDPVFSSLCEAVLMGDLDFEEGAVRALELPHQRTTR